MSEIEVKNSPRAAPVRLKKTDEQRLASRRRTIKIPGELPPYISMNLREFVESTDCMVRCFALSCLCQVRESDWADLIADVLIKTVGSFEHPIEKRLVMEAIAALMMGRPPQVLDALTGEAPAAPAPSPTPASSEPLPTHLVRHFAARD